MNFEKCPDGPTQGFRFGSGFSNVILFKHIGMPLVTDNKMVIDIL